MRFYNFGVNSPGNYNVTPIANVGNTTIKIRPGSYLLTVSNETVEIALNATTCTAGKGTPLVAGTQIEFFNPAEGLTDVAFYSAAGTGRVMFTSMS